MRSLSTISALARHAFWIAADARALIDLMIPCEALWMALTAGGLKRSALAPTYLLTPA